MGNGISILIITYNRPADLLELLESLGTQINASDVLDEVLVLDNASTVSYQSVTDYIAQRPDLKIKFIQSDENLGVARGRNKLMTMARGKWLLVIDDDVLFLKPDDLQRIARYPEKTFFANTNTAVFDLRVIFYDTKDVQITAFPHKKYEQYKDKKQFLTSYFIGCAHLLRRDVLDITGVYPVDFFYGMEEYDLSYRILDAGFTIGYDDEVTIEHKESPLGRQSNEQKLRMQWVNKSKVAWRYLPFLYFVSTAFMWGLQYLKHTKWNLKGFLSGVGTVMQIPFREKRQRVRGATMNYLHKVQARLWF